MYAAALLFVAAGCSAGSFLMSWVGSGGKQQVVSGSVDVVAERLRVALDKINIIVAVNPMGDGIVRLNGETKSKQRFALVLKQQRTSRGENTVVTIEWEKGEKDADEQFWATVLDLLVQPAPIANGTPASTDGINSGR
ncbi:MAG TPA: hypothetical protein VMG10_14175 [Gemmataceae bacterium]|nr:hypothetical protein [Gemmataceae bacterium]